MIQENGMPGWGLAALIALSIMVVAYFDTVI